MMILNVVVNSYIYSLQYSNCQSEVTYFNVHYSSLVMAYARVYVFLVQFQLINS